jgi:hypothetical protein
MKNHEIKQPQIKYGLQYPLFKNLTELTKQINIVKLQCNLNSNSNTDLELKSKMQIELTMLTEKNLININTANPTCCWRTILCL